MVRSYVWAAQLANRQVEHHMVRGSPHMLQHLYAATVDRVYGEVFICRDLYMLRSWW